MLTFVLLCNWSDLHINKDLYGKRNKVQKYENLLLNYEYIRSERLQFCSFRWNQISNLLEVHYNTKVNIYRAWATCG